MMNTSKKLRNQIRKMILEINKSPAVPETHLTITGKKVPFGCDECVHDIEHRIEDAKNRRDSCEHRTDSREHYNGILKVLRRELRSARKINDSIDS